MSNMTEGGRWDVGTWDVAYWEYVSATIGPTVPKPKFPGYLLVLLMDLLRIKTEHSQK